MQFVASLGRGPASLLWHVSGWTLTSVSGFSAAASRVIQRNLSARQASMWVPEASTLLSPHAPCLLSLQDGALLGLCSVSACSQIPKRLQHQWLTSCEVVNAGAIMEMWQLLG